MRYLLLGQQKPQNYALIQAQIRQYLKNNGCYNKMRVISSKYERIL